MCLCTEQAESSNWNVVQLSEACTHATQANVLTASA